MTRTLNIADLFCGAGGTSTGALELAAAQGFPRDYRFAGTKTEQVKQIGNAVPCGLSRALVSAVLSQRANPFPIPDAATPGQQAA